MMAAEGDNNFMRYVYRGEEDEIIPLGATHIFVGDDSTVILRRAFYEHPNIVEVICHENVERIERSAFYGCPNLRRLIMPGVKEVGDAAFYRCDELEDVECGKLEIIKQGAFCDCKSLWSISLPSARIVAGFAFHYALTELKFGSKLERMNDSAIGGCFALERITIPLKDVRYVDLVDGAVLHETVAALQLEEWKNDMNGEIDSINQILPNARVGGWDYDADEHRGSGEKARVVRTWIRTVLQKIVRYKAEHERLLNEAATQLQLVLPQDLIMNNVVSFLALPSHSFEVEDESDEEEDDN